MLPYLLRLKFCYCKILLKRHQIRKLIKRGNMNYFQKLFITCLAAAGLLIGSNAANAVTISDVPQGYWAANSIIEAVQNNYLDLSGTRFRPEEPITRAEFANAIYNVIQRAPIPTQSGFNDVSYQIKYGRSILTLQQLQIVCGYPDGDFKPDGFIKRSEASSVVANVVRTDFWDTSVLNRFKDKNDVPVWATPSYINNIINDIYVNYPKSDVLLPNEYLSRAEAAILMHKLRIAVNSYKDAYLPQEVNYTDDVNSEDSNKFVPVFVGTNTLGEFKYSYQKNVNLYENKKVIIAGNIVPVRALQRFDARTAKEGDVLTYVSPKDVYSIEGTKLYNQGTKFIGYVDRTQKSYWLKKQNKAYIVFNRAILNDGTEFPVAGVLYSTYKGKVVEEKAKNSLRVKNDATKKFRKRNAAWKFTNKLVPVIKYSEDTKDNLFMLITGDMIIPDSNL